MAAVAEFADPSSRCQVHNATYNLILMEPALNFNLEIQAIGRIHRVGQVHPQKAYRMFQDHMFNRYVTGKNILKMVPQLAAQYSQLGRFRDEMLTRACEDHLRQLMGVTDDFPRHDALLNMKKIGHKQMEGQWVSGRMSQFVRKNLAWYAKDTSDKDSRARTQGEDTSGLAESSKRRKLSK